MQKQFEPLNYEWLEKELASNELERHWFKFQRETKDHYGDDWSKAVLSFKAHFKNEITEDKAIELTKKWKRFIIGSWNTVASQNKNVQDWKKSAIEFEVYHNKIEQRMRKWTEEHESNFPKTKTKEPVRFLAGSFFNTCIEKIPKIFTNVQCSYIKKGVELVVTSYDEELDYIRLDFSDDIRNILKQNTRINPWDSKSSYIIYLPPHEVEQKIESF